MCEIMENFGERMMAKGLEQGLSQGLSKGLAEGENKGRLNTLVGLVQDGMLDIKHAAQKADMTPEAFQQLVSATP